jgi:ferrous iron transport protein A
MFVMPTLDQVPPGSACRIEAVNGPPALVQRLLEMGLMEGERVAIITRAPLGDPIEIESTLSRLSLRKNEAGHIQVTLSD